jgi:hypothetical protein
LLQKMWDTEVLTMHMRNDIPKHSRAASVRWRLSRTWRFLESVVGIFRLPIFVITFDGQIKVKAVLVSTNDDESVKQRTLPPGGHKFFLKRRC